MDASPSSQTDIERRPSSAPPPLPYEIFILAIEALAAEAYVEASKVPAFWQLCEGEPDGPEQFYVGNGFKCHHRWSGKPPYGQHSQKRRFALIRDISQIDHRTRTAVHQIFPRFPRHPIYEGEDCSESKEPPPKPLFVWICPSVDSFCHPPDWVNGKGPSALAAALRNPTPRSAVYLRCIQNLQFMYLATYLLPTSSYPDPAQAGDLSFSALPNLKVVKFFASGDVFGEESGASHAHADVLVRDTDIFRELGDRVRADPDYLEPWNRLWERGVRIILRRHTGPRWVPEYLEFLPTPEGPLVKFLEPECWCYSGL